MEKRKEKLQEWGYIGFSVGIMENKKKIISVSWGSIGIMEKTMETCIVYRVSERL